MPSRALTLAQTVPDAGLIRAAMILSALFVVLTAGAARAADAEGDAASAEADIALSAMVRTIAFSAPVDGVEMNSRFGPRRLSFERRARMHQGVDFAAPTGTPVLAAAEGVVTDTGVSRTYGRYAEVRHANGVTSFYAHMSRVSVREGQRLSAGETLGAIGSTGRSTGPHLHFEIRRDGRRIDPTDFLGRSFAIQDVAPEAEADDDAPVHFAAAPVTFGYFRILTPAFHR